MSRPQEDMFLVDHVACLYTKYLVQRKDRLLLLKPRKVIKVAWGLVCVFSKGLVTNYGEGGGGRHVKFYPYEKGGGDITSFSHTERGHKTF